MRFHTSLVHTRLIRGLSCQLPDAFLGLTLAMLNHLVRYDNNIGLADVFSAHGKSFRTYGKRPGHSNRDSIASQLSRSWGEEGSDGGFRRVNRGVRASPQITSDSPRRHAATTGAGPRSKELKKIGRDWRAIPTVPRRLAGERRGRIRAGVDQTDFAAANFRRCRTIFHAC